MTENIINITIMWGGTSDTLRKTIIETKKNKKKIKKNITIMTYDQK